MADNSDDSEFSDASSPDNSDVDDKEPIAKAKRSGANLSCPKKASIARERKVQSNPALFGKKQVTCGAHGPKTSAWQRIQEHKNEHFTVVKGLLRCDACKESLSKKKSTVKIH